MKKRQAFIRVISYIGAVLLATAVILLILAVVKVPVEKSKPAQNEGNQTSSESDPGQNDTSQGGPGNSGGDTPAPSSSGVPNVSSRPGQTNTAGGAQTSPAPARSSSAPGGNDPGPAPDPPAPSVLDTLIDGVQNILPEGGIL